MPRSYQFFYKGSTCAFRQESMRRAWDLLPKCALIQRKGNEPKEEDKKEELSVHAASSQGASALESQVTRRVSNKLVPVPLATLARVQEETGTASSELNVKFVTT